MTKTSAVWENFHAILEQSAEIKDQAMSALTVMSASWEHTTATMSKSAEISLLDLVVKR